MIHMPTLLKFDFKLDEVFVGNASYLRPMAAYLVTRQPPSVPHWEGGLRLRKKRQGAEFWALRFCKTTPCWAVPSLQSWRFLFPNSFKYWLSSLYGFKWLCIYIHFCPWVWAPWSHICSCLWPLLESPFRVVVFGRCIIRLHAAPILWLKSFPSCPQLVSITLGFSRVCLQSSFTLAFNFAVWFELVVFPLTSVQSWTWVKRAHLRATFTLTKGGG